MDQVVIFCGVFIKWVVWYGKYIMFLVQGNFCGDQVVGFCGGFDNDNCFVEVGNDLVVDWKMLCLGLQVYCLFVDFKV